MRQMRGSLWSSHESLHGKSLWYLRCICFLVTLIETAFRSKLENSSLGEVLWIPGQVFYSIQTAWGVDYLADWVWSHLPAEDLAFHQSAVG